MLRFRNKFTLVATVAKTQHKFFVMQKMRKTNFLNLFTVNSSIQLELLLISHKVNPVLWLKLANF